jgi:hypothetical protein
MVKIFPFQVYPGTPQFLREPMGPVKRCRTPCVIPEVRAEGILKLRILPGIQIGPFQFL